MNNREIKEQVNIEMDAVARALEDKICTNPELDGLKMPDDSYERLLEQIAEEKHTRPSKGPRAFRKRILLSVALIAILVIGMGVVSSGSKLFVPQVVDQVRDGEMNITITDEYEPNGGLSEEETYTEIEEKLGILALRLGYKPNGMELINVFIDGDMGEAMLDYFYDEQIFSVYMNKQNQNATFNVQTDGVVVDTVTLFAMEEELKIFKIDREESSDSYYTQLEYGNAYYFLSGSVELDLFKKIISEIFFRGV